MIKNFRIIIAIDFPNKKEALNCIKNIDPKIYAIKIGMQLFVKEGIKFIEYLIKKDFKVFLDLKLIDIPSTIYKTCSLIASLGVWMFNVHSLGGKDMLNSARKAVEDTIPNNNYKPILLAVTILTSFNINTLKEISINKSIQKQVLDLSRISYECGVDGIICSPKEAKYVKKEFGNNFIVVTPGIRNKIININNDDQERTMDPIESIKNGSDHIVIGRLFRKSKNPKYLLKKITKSIDS